MMPDRNFLSALATKLLLVAMAVLSSAACGSDAKDEPQNPPMDSPLEDLHWPSDTLPPASADGPPTLVIVGRIGSVDLTDTPPYLASQSVCSADGFKATFLGENLSACELDLDAPENVLPSPGVYAPAQTSLIFTIGHDPQYYGAGPRRTSYGTIRVIRQEIANAGPIELMARFSWLTRLATGTAVPADIWVSLAGRCP